ncbi:MAG: SDR family NAD(P)-dependent oxidoreductase [Solirubrobacteraceae bacterium]
MTYEYDPPGDRPLQGRARDGLLVGIGRATAQRLAGSGWTVYATARRLESIADLEPRGCNLLALDVTDEDSMQAAVRTVEEAEGAVGVLVNNAGYSQSGAVETVPIEHVRRQFETNVFGLARMAQLVLPSMRRQRWGRIVNVSSMGGKLTFPGGGFYHATKYAVEALSDALRFEVQGFGIDVVVIEPGLIKTGFATAAVGALGDATSHGAAAADDPYATFNRAVAKSTAGVYEGPLAKLGGRPETVAAAREGDHCQAPAHALPRHAVRPAGHGPAPVARRPRLGQVPRESVPNARKGVAIELADEEVSR